MISFPVMPKPPRQAVVVNTSGGDRIKPACPICDAVSWAKPSPGEFDQEQEKFEFVATARHSMKDGSRETLHRYGVDTWLCLNCGFLWQRLLALREADASQEGE